MIKRQSEIGHRRVLLELGAVKLNMQCKAGSRDSTRYITEELKETKA